MAWRRSQKDRKARTEHAGVAASVEQGGLETERRHCVAVGFGDSLDEPAQTQAAQFVAHPTGTDLIELHPEVLRKQWPQLLISQSLREQTEHEQHRQQGLNPLFPVLQRADLLPIHGVRSLELFESGASDLAVVGEGFDLQYLAIGSKANFPQTRKVDQPTAHVEVVGVVDGGLGAQGAPLLVVTA